MQELLGDVLERRMVRCKLRLPEVWCKLQQTEPKRLQLELDDLLFPSLTARLALRMKGPLSNQPLGVALNEFSERRSSRRVNTDNPLAADQGQPEPDMVNE